MDFSKQLAEINQEHAIESETKSRLSDILPILNKERLSAIAAANGLPGRSKMKKQELVSGLYELLADVHRLEGHLLLTDDKEWELFVRFSKEPFVRNDRSVVPGNYLFFMERGLMFSFYDGVHLDFVIPEEIREAYSRINRQAFRDARARRQLIYHYILAFANLYGAFKPQQLLDIFNDQNERKLSEEEFEQVYAFNERRRQIYYREGGYVVSEDINPNEVEELLEARKHKPMYIPGKNELLNYADHFYYEHTPQLDRLKEYVLDNLTRNEQLVDWLVDDVQLACSMERPLGDIMYEFERRNILGNKRQMKTVLDLVVDIYNHTRMRSNYGHTPAESSGAGGASPSSLVYLKQQKVGRNEPCPCGSGIKYKKCCGKQ